MGRVRSPKRRVRDDDFVFGLSSDYARIILESSFYWRKHFREFPLTSRFRGRRSIWWGWRVTLLAPRIGNDVSYVTQIIDDVHFAWQAQYLVRLEGDFTCSTHWKWRFICDADHWWLAFCVAGAVFGEVRVGLFVAGAALRDILGDSRDAKCCILQYKIVSKLGRVRSPKRRVRDDDFIVGYPRISSDILGYPRIMVESSFYWRKHFRDFPHKSWPSRFRARHSIWWGWRVTWLAPRIGNDVSYVTQIIDDNHFAWQAQYLVRFQLSLLFAPRIGNDVSYVTQIIDDIHFAWQAQYLVKLQGAFTASTHWKWRCICDADHWWRSFCVARAVFGEVAGCLYCLHALEMTFHMWRRSLMTLILRGRRSIWWSWTLILVAPRIVNDVSK